MVPLTVERVPEGGNAYQTRRMVRGVLTSEPRVGESMTIFRCFGRQARSLTTSPIQRILQVAEKVLYVETENSVYRLVTG